LQPRILKFQNSDRNQRKNLSGSQISSAIREKGYSFRKNKEIKKSLNKFSAGFDIVAAIITILFLIEKDLSLIRNLLVEVSGICSVRPDISSQVHKIF